MPAAFFLVGCSFFLLTVTTNALQQGHFQCAGVSEKAAKRQAEWKECRQPGRANVPNISGSKQIAQIFSPSSPPPIVSSEVLRLEKWWALSEKRF